ncbi:MAG: stage II sporulation protein R [Clostridiales bacterium]|nr:stage II sporulation protein R [Clostridiales bacterium]
MKKNTIMMASLIFLILLIIIGTGMNPPLANNNLIRLHVTANSDSDEDQELKYQVRDQLLLSFGDIFRDAQTIGEARNLINESLDDLKGIASREINRQGFDYPVDASLGIASFPTKVYGDLVYPAGEYEALRVVIGEGSGANWWCVMFPPLCFVDVSSGVVSEDISEEIDEESIEVTSVDENTDDEEKTQDDESTTDNEEKTVVYTFKLAQWWKNFRAWVSNLFA